jgi:hypothetical protein
MRADVATPLGPQHTGAKDQDRIDRRQCNPPGQRLGLSALGHRSTLAHHRATTLPNGTMLVVGGT